MKPEFNSNLEYWFLLKTEHHQINQQGVQGKYLNMGIKGVYRYARQ